MSNYRRYATYFVAGAAAGFGLLVVSPRRNVHRPPHADAKPFLRAKDVVGTYKTLHVDGKTIRVYRIDGFSPEWVERKLHEKYKADYRRVVYTPFDELGLTQEQQDDLVLHGKSIELPEKFY